MKNHLSEFRSLARPSAVTLLCAVTLAGPRGSTGTPACECGSTFELNGTARSGCPTLLGQFVARLAFLGYR